MFVDLFAKKLCQVFLKMLDSNFMLNNKNSSFLNESKDMLFLQRQNFIDIQNKDSLK